MKSGARKALAEAIVSCSTIRQITSIWKAAAARIMPAGCPIKSNINAKGEMDLSRPLIKELRQDESGLAQGQAMMLK
jgi:hypothetical protein